MALAPISVNGRTSSWGNIWVKLDGISIGGLREISYGDSVSEERSAGMGLAHRATRRSMGRYEVEEGTLKGYAPDIDAVIKLAASKSLPPGNWSGSELTIIVTFAFMQDEPIRVHTLHRCRILSIKDSFAEGTESLMGELSFAPLYIDRDGLTGYNRTIQI